MATVEETLDRLSRSGFRARQRLNEEERRYLAEKGEAAVREHARQFVRDRLAPADPPHDGRQTPWHGHPVFVAQHACACCCRGCLEKWYRVPRGVPLTEGQQEKIVTLLMAWLARQA